MIIRFGLPTMYLEVKLRPRTGNKNAKVDLKAMMSLTAERLHPPSNTNIEFTNKRLKLQRPEFGLQLHYSD